MEKAVSLMTGQEDDEASEMRVLRIMSHLYMDYHCAPFHLGPREVDNQTTLNMLLLVPLAARSHRTSKSCSSDLPGTCSSMAMRILFMLDCSRWLSRIFNMSEPLVAQIISIVTWTCFCTLNHSDCPTPENIRRSEYAENWYN